MTTVERFLESVGRGTAPVWTPTEAYDGDGFAETWDTADATRNILLYPLAAQRPRTDVLAHVRGGLVTDSSLRPRVSAIVGPGATIRGIAERVHPVFTAGASTSNPAPTIEEVARALLVYSQYYIPVPAMRGYADGLRIPLPIEIEQPSGDWIVNGNTIRLWTRSYDAAWAPLLDRRPARLDQPDLAVVPHEVRHFLATERTALARGIHLLARVLTNPFLEVFFFFEAMKQMTAGDRFECVLNLLDNAVNHQMRLLATLTAGHAVLRRVERVLRATVLSPPPGITPAQTASRTRGLNMLDSALRPGGVWTPRRELPETPQQLANRPGGLGPWQAVRADDPAGGRHRMVLGRDVLAGAIGSFTSGGQTFTGPAYGGRIPPRAFIAAHANRINPSSDPALAARLRIVQAIAVNEGFLDAVRMQDRGILSIGMQQWSAHADLELPALLAHLELMDEHEFDLFFGIYDLDVRANGTDAHGNPRFMLQRVEPNDNRVDLTAWNARRDFFLGTTAGTTTTFRTEWAARSREAAIASLTVRATQVLEATGRFDRVAREVGSLTVGGHAVPLTTLITSQLGAALILDAHINMPANVRPDLQAAVNAAGTHPNADALDRAITVQYRTIRHTHNTPARNANIAGQGLDPAHGSFGGW